MRASMFSVARAILGAAVLALGPSIAQGDFAGVVTNPVEVTGVNASAGAVGGVSRLQLSVENAGTERLTLVSVESNVSEHASIVARTGEPKMTILPAIGIGVGETVQLNTSHLLIELCPLRRPLTEGEVFSVTLRFSAGDINVDAHVHSDRHSRTLPC